VRGELIAYLDGELGAAREDEVRAHLRACAACRSEARALEQSFALLECLEVPEVPAGLEERVRARITDAAGARAGGADLLRLGGPLRPWLAVAAALLVVGALAIVLYRSLDLGERGLPGPASDGAVFAQRDGAGVEAPNGEAVGQRVEPATAGTATAWQGDPDPGMPGTGPSGEAGTAVAGGAERLPAQTAGAAEIPADGDESAEALAADEAPDLPPVASVPDGPHSADDAAEPELAAAPRTEPREAPPAEAIDPELEREAILALELLENLELVEALDLLEALEELEDPAWLLPGNGESG
jgi:hypothetical protein